MCLLHDTQPRFAVVSRTTFFFIKLIPYVSNDDTVFILTLIRSYNMELLKSHKKTLTWGGGEKR